jgi:hypothetical protein
VVDSTTERRMPEVASRVVRVAQRRRPWAMMLR